MNKKFALRILPIVGTLVILAVGPVSAQTINTTVSATSTVRIGTGVSGGVGVNLKADVETRVLNLANQEIDRRLTALNALNARVNAMVKLSDTEKTALSSDVQVQIGAMNALQAQIKLDSSSSTALKLDVQSITRSYRIFALVLPQGAIEAMADRVMTIVSDMGTIAAKLQTRISEAQSSGANMSAAVSALADLNVKTADANVQAQAAVSEVSGLQPDNGDKTVMQSNTATLKDAHSKLKVAQQDLVAARKDAGSIVKEIESLKVSASSSSTINGTSTNSQ